MRWEQFEVAKKRLHYTLDANAMSDSDLEKWKAADRWVYSALMLQRRLAGTRA